MITDLEMFIKFFKMMGVKAELFRGLSTERLPTEQEPVASVTHLIVSQAIFCFDKDDNYLGVLADDMGFFEPNGKGYD